MLNMDENSLLEEERMMEEAEMNEEFLSKIEEAVEDNVRITVCCDRRTKGCSVIKKCTVHNYWKLMNKQVLEILSNTSIEDIVNDNENNPNQLN